MYRFLFFLMSLLCPLACLSITVKYLTGYKLTSDGQLLTCYNTLVIDSSGSAFFSEKQFRQAVVNDSLRACGTSPYEAIDIWKREKLLGHTNYAVFKNSPSKGRITVSDEIMNYYFCEEPMPEFKWELLSGDTIILGLKACKASTVYRGRKWLVFYSSDIPTGDGPWKLSGLPGLILYARDSLGEFSFDAKEISDSVVRHPSAGFFTKRGKRSTVGEMARLRRLMFWDDRQFNKEVMGKASQLFDAQGHPLPPEHRRACLIEE